MSIFRLFFVSVAALATLMFQTAFARAADADPEKARIYEVDVWVHTCDLVNAGTNDFVSVRLDTATGQQFFLDNPGNDRERGGIDYYHVTLENIGRLSDIKRIQFDLKGNDGWCVDQVWLWVNGDALYVNSTDPVWLDNDNSNYLPYYKIFSSTLRAFMWWPESSSSPQVCKAPKEMTKGDMKSTLDGIVGDKISQGVGFPSSVKKVSWRGDSSLSRRDSNSWKYVVKFRAEVKDYYDADVEATYDVDVSCGSDLSLTPRLISKSVKFDIPLWVTILSGGAVNAVNLIVDAIVGANSKIRYQRSVRRLLPLRWFVRRSR